LDVVDHLFELGEGVLHLPNLSLDFLLLAFVVGSFELDGLCLINNDSRVFLYGLLMGLLLPHLSGEDGELLPRPLNHHLGLFDDLQHLRFVNLLFFVLFLQLLNLLSCVVYLLSLCLDPPL